MEVASTAKQRVLDYRSCVEKRTSSLFGAMSEARRQEWRDVWDARCKWGRCGEMDPGGGEVRQGRRRVVPGLTWFPPLPFLALALGPFLRFSIASASAPPPWRLRGDAGKLLRLASITKASSTRVRAVIKVLGFQAAHQRTHSRTHSGQDQATRTSQDHTSQGTEARTNAIHCNSLRTLAQQHTRPFVCSRCIYSHKV